jgi:hypothetical protein
MPCIGESTAAHILSFEKMRPFVSTGENHQFSP